MTMEDGTIMPVDSTMLKAKFDQLYHTIVHTEQVCYKDIPSSQLNTCREVRDEGSKIGTLINEQVSSTQYETDNEMTSSKIKTTGDCEENKPDLVPSSFRKSLQTSSIDSQSLDLYDSFMMETWLGSGKRRNAPTNSSIDLVTRRKEQPVVEIIKHFEKKSLQENKSSDKQNETRWQNLRTYNCKGSELSTNSSDLTIVSKEEYGKYRNRNIRQQNRPEALQASSYVNHDKENLASREENSGGSIKSLFHGNGSTEDIAAKTQRSRLSMKIKYEKKGDDLTKVSRTEVQRHRKQESNLITMEHDAERLLMHLDKSGTELKQNDIFVHVILGDNDTKSRGSSKRKLDTREKTEIAKEESKCNYTSLPCHDNPKSNDSYTKSNGDSFTKVDSDPLEKMVNIVSKRKRLSSGYDSTEPVRKCSRSSTSDSTNKLDETSFSTKISKDDHNNTCRHEETLVDRNKIKSRASKNKIIKNVRTSKHSNISEDQIKNGPSVKLKKGLKDVAIKESSCSSVVKQFHRKIDSYVKTVQSVTNDAMKCKELSRESSENNKVTDIKRLTLETIDDIHKQIADTNLNSPDNLVQSSGAINIDTLESLIPLNNNKEIHKRKVREKVTNKHHSGLKSYATAPIWQRVTLDYQ